MEMTGAQTVPASPEQTWRALNDPDTLKACIAGCDSIEKLSDSEYQLSMTAKIGPVSAKFKGRMRLADLNPPNSYTLSFEGQGGAAGFAKGAARVNLAPEGTGTRIAYTVSAQVGGKLAQIGSRLIDGAAKKMADDFFSCFATQLGGVPAAQTAAPPGKTAVTSGGKRTWIWVAVIVAAIVILYLLKR